MTDTSLFCNWLEEGEVSPRTIAGYLNDLELFAKWFSQTNGHAMEPSILTPSDIREYRAFLVARGAKPSLVNRRLAALRAYGTWSVIGGKVTINPALGIKGIAEQKLSPRWLDRISQFKLMQAVEKNIQAAQTQSAKFLAIRDQAMVVIVLNTGLRISELCGLLLSDIEVSQRKGQIRVRQGKGSKSRKIPCNERVRKVFQSWMAVRPDYGNKYLLVGQRGDAMTSSAVHRRIASLGRQAELAGELSPHVLRHTFAKNLINAGEGIEKVSLLLGHSNLNTTRIYIIPGERDLELAVERLE